LSAVHVIRLREPLESQSFPDGSTQYRRKFGQPRLSSGEAVWLLCPEGSTIHLNGELAAAVCDVTARLMPRNELVIVSQLPLGEVRLEIRSAG
jgi:hypothetical protein